MGGEMSTKRQAGQQETRGEVEGKGGEAHPINISTNLLQAACNFEQMHIEVHADTAALTFGIF
jgi:hypothetical protein